MSEQISEKGIRSSFWSNLFKRSLKESEMVEILQEMPPFSELKNNQLLELISLMHNRQYVSGEHIFHQDDPGIGLYIINQGEVHVEFTTPRGRKITLADFKRGDFFGELALLDGDKRSASAIAKTDCKVSVLFKPDLDLIIQKNHKEGLLILQGIIKIVATRLRHLDHEYFSLYEQLLSIKEENHGITNT